MNLLLLFQVRFQQKKIEKNKSCLRVMFLPDVFFFQLFFQCLVVTLYNRILKAGVVIPLIFPRNP